MRPGDLLPAQCLESTILVYEMLYLKVVKRVNLHDDDDDNDDDGGGRKLWR